MTKKCIRMSLTATIPAAAKLLVVLANYVDHQVTDISIYDCEQEFPDPDPDDDPAAAADADDGCPRIRPFGYND